MAKVYDFKSIAPPTHNYSGNATEGMNYKNTRGMDISDIAKLIRSELKSKFPECKFSVTIERYSGGQSLYISLMSAPFEAALGGYDLDDNNLPFDGYTQLNEKRFLKEYGDGKNNGAVLTPSAWEVLGYATAYASSFNFNDIDSMTDYFNVRFYLHVGIGKYDKPFRVTAKESVSSSKKNNKCEIGEYKGHPTINIPCGGRGFMFGVAKAKAVLEHLDEIKGFVESN